MSALGPLEFTLPAALNARQLDAELEAAGIIDAESNLYLDLLQVNGFSAPGVRISEADRDAIQAVIDAHTPAPTVPAKVSTWRLRAIAQLEGLDDDIDAAIATLDEPARTVASVGWDRSFEIERDASLVIQMTTALGLTAAEMDEMFRQADAIPT